MVFMYKIKLLTNVIVKNHGQELTGCIFEKDLQLPFIPFEGLTIQLNDEMADDFTVEDIRYCVEQDIFYLDADDVQDNTNLPSEKFEQSMREVMEHYQDHGWTLLEGETGPFIS
jgi:hypothetical protein